MKGKIKEEKKNGNKTVKGNTGTIMAIKGNIKKKVYYHLKK